MGMKVFFSINLKKTLSGVIMKKYVNICKHMQIHKGMLKTLLICSHWKRDSALFICSCYALPLPPPNIFFGKLIDYNPICLYGLFLDHGLRYLKITLWFCLTYPWEGVLTLDFVKVSFLTWVWAVVPCFYQSRCRFGKNGQDLTINN